MVKYPSKMDEKELIDYVTENYNFYIYNPKESEGKFIGLYYENNGIRERIASDPTHFEFDKFDKVKPIKPTEDFIYYLGYGYHCNASLDSLVVTEEKIKEHIRLLLDSNKLRDHEVTIAHNIIIKFVHLNIDKKEHTKDNGFPILQPIAEFMDRCTTFSVKNPSDDLSFRSDHKNLIDDV